jgi:site-specific recombinase XerC
MYLKVDLQHEEKTYRGYNSNVKKLMAWCVRDTGAKFSEIINVKGLLELSDLIASNRGPKGEGLKQKTYQTHYSALKSFVLFLGRKGYLKGRGANKVVEEVPATISSTAK